MTFLAGTALSRMKREATKSIKEIVETRNEISGAKWM